MKIFNMVEFLNIIEDNIANWIRKLTRNIGKLIIKSVNPHTPVAQKVADELAFGRFQGERGKFFKSDLTDPLRFLMRIFWKTPI